MSLRILHYINQFFGQKGGEEAANLPPEIHDGPIAIGQQMQKMLSDDHQIVATIICGDSYFNENLEESKKFVQAALEQYQPDLVVAGPAFNAGRYGMACGQVAQIAAEMGLTGAGRLIWAHALSREQRPRLLKTMMEDTSDDSKQMHCNISTAMNGYTQIDDGLFQPPNCRLVETWWVAQHHYEYCLNELNSLLQHTESAVNVEDMAQRVHSPTSLIEGLVEQQCQANLWQRHSNGITRFGIKANALNAEQQALYHEINLTGRRCFDANQHKQPRMQHLLKTLMERKWIIPMEDKLFITAEEYQTLIGEIIVYGSVGETFTIAQARDKTGLARKQLIPLLNRMERDGWVKRVGDLRMIQKQYSNTK